MKILYRPMRPIGRLIIEGYTSKGRKTIKLNDKKYLKAYANHLEEFDFPQWEIKKLREIAKRIK